MTNRSGQYDHTYGGMLPMAATTFSPAKQVSEFVNTIVNAKLEEAAKVVADMMNFVQIARDHATRQLNEDHPDHEKAWDNFKQIDERQQMLHRKLQMIRAAQAYEGDE